MTSVMCGIQNMTQMNFSVKQKWTQRHREQVCDCQGEGSCGRDGEGVWG